MDKQIEEMMKDIAVRMAMAKGVAGSMNKGVEGWLAEYLVNKGWQQIPENAVVLTEKEYKKELQEQHNKGVTAGFAMRKFQKHSIEQKTRKETAEKFAERLKEKCKELQDKYSHICKNKYEVIQETCRYEGVTAVKNSIDEICKEITEGL